MRRSLLGLAVAVGLCLAAFAAAQEAPAPTPSPKPHKPPSKNAKNAKPDRPPVDFSGVWELDTKASHGVVKALENSAFKVQQTGNRITIEPIGQNSSEHLMADQIIVDGKQYEKNLGKDKGTVIAKWGNDGTSLWMEAVSGSNEDPRAAVQRMVWRLQDFGNTWTRQSWTISGAGSKQTFLIFRRRPPDWVPTIVFPTPQAPTPAAP
jgi:hypothetical protein